VVVLLALTWGELRESREHIQSQDRKITALFKATRPALDEVQPLVDDAAPLLRQAAPVLAQVLAAGRGIDDVVTRLPTVLAGIQGLTNEGIPLARGLSAADLPSLVADLRASDLPALVSSLQASDIPSTVASADEVLSGLSSGDRLNQALDLTTALLMDVRDRDLPRKADASSRRLKDLLKVQRRAYSTLQQSLRIQVRTLEHVRSIDDKTGGELPPPALSAPGSG
jgi:hypothetical protein